MPRVLNLVSALLLASRVASVKLAHFLSLGFLLFKKAEISELHASQNVEDI